MNTSIARDHNGKMHLYVAGVPALGADVAAMATVNGEAHFVVYVPSRCVTLREVDNVVPFRA